MIKRIPLEQLEEIGVTRIMMSGGGLGLDDMADEGVRPALEALREQVDKLTG